jgi:phospholipid/cholesterol/gamma-HCH transport system substrate-binding protein
VAEASSGWREVRIGAAVTGFLFAALSVFWVQRGRNPFAEAYQLVLFVEDAKGLEEGAPVSLSGLRVGEVRDVSVLPPGSPLRTRYADGLRGMNIRIVLQVGERYREEITDRSLARIGSLGVSGARYVRIEKGPVGGRSLTSGGRLRVGPTLDVEQLLARSTEILNRIESLNANAEEVRRKMREGGGTLGRFMADPTDNQVAENIEVMNLGAARVMRAIDQGGGTLPLERRTRRIRSNVEAFQSSVGAIRRRFEEGQGTLPRLTGDSALLAALARLEGKAAAVSQLLETGEGSLGRFLNDPELLDQLEVLTLQLDSLAVQVREDPLGSIDVDLH